MMGLRSSSPRREFDFGGSRLESNDLVSDWRVDGHCCIRSPSRPIR